MDDVMRLELINNYAKKGKKCFYGELMTKFGYDHLAIAKELGEISTFEHHEGRPLLSAIVIGKDNIDRIPGKGFFDMARDELGFKIKKDYDEEKKFAYACQMIILSYPYP